MATKKRRPTKSPKAASKPQKAAPDVDVCHYVALMFEKIFAQPDVAKCIFSAIAMHAILGSDVKVIADEKTLDDLRRKRVMAAIRYGEHLATGLAVSKWTVGTSTGCSWEQTTKPVNVPPAPAPQATSTEKAT